MGELSQTENWQEKFNPIILELRPKISELIEEITKTSDNELKNFIISEKEEAKNIKLCFSCITLEDFYFINELISKNS